MPPGHAWLAQHATLRSDHEGFSCLEGCGFCCTYPPQVSEALWKHLERNAGLKRIAVDEAGTLRLPLQATCGACVLLDERRCQAYDDRPRHCRLFPFHLYFGRSVELYANRVCPGLDAGDGEAMPLSEAIAHAFTGISAEELDARAETARRVHADFERNAREAGVWADPDDARATALAAARIDEPGWQAALEPFRSERDELLPTLVLSSPSFEWRMWRAHDDGLVERLRLHEDGTVGTVEGSVRLDGAPAAPSAASRSVTERLLGHECAVGAAFDLVDASDYQMSVQAAFDRLASDVLSAVALREPLLVAEGLPVDEPWLAASYEPEFYDLPTIGGWL